MSLSAASRIRKIWKVSHPLPDENRLALFDEAQQELVVFNQIGGEIWQRIDGQRSLEEILDELLALSEPSPDREQAYQEVERFLQDLLGRGAIEVVE